MKAKYFSVVLLFAAVVTTAVSCSKEDEKKANQASHNAEKIVGCWNLEMTDDYPTPWYRYTHWEFTPENEWIQTSVYNDGEHYDSIVNRATYALLDDSVTLFQDNGVVSGLRIVQLDDDTMKTREWYQGQFQPDGAWFTYTFSRM